MGVTRRNASWRLEQADADDERKHGLNCAEERPKNAEGVYKNGKYPRLTII